jgi:hypothetical protein
MTDYTLYLSGVLAVLGLFVQFLRGQSKVAEFWTYAIAAVLALSGYALCHAFGHDVRLEIIQAVIAVPGNVAAVLGGTFAASGSAKAGLNVFPVTNSK